MRIVFLTHYFPPEGNAPATRVFEMARRWVKLGHEVAVITGVPNVPNGVPYPGYRNRLVQRETMDGIRVTHVWTFLAPNKGRIRRSINYLSYLVSATLAGAFAARPDVVLATSPQFFCGWAGAWVARMKHRPFILEIRDIWPDSIETVGAVKNRPLLRLLGWMEKKLYARARHIVAVGEGYKEQLVARGVPPEKVTVITNGIDTTALQPGTKNQELLEQYHLENRFVVAYIGTIGMACGLDIALRAAGMLKERGDARVVFLLVGDGALRQELEEKARGEGLQNVVFAGLQPKERIPAFLSVTDACLVHLRKKDLFKSVLPSKIFEAAAMARPIILGVQGHAARLVEQAGMGICIEPENEQELVAAADRLSTDAQAARKMGEAGRRHVSERFDLDALARQYADVIEKTVAAPSP
jgi:glycosyltransferase involved in cell wall biosynthesis